MTKADKEFAEKLDFEDINFPLKIKRHSRNRKKRIPSALVFLLMKIRRNIQFMYQKNVVKKNLLIYY